MKKIIVLILGVCMCFLLCSCGGPSPDELLYDAHNYLTGENGKEQSFDEAMASYLKFRESGTEPTNDWAIRIRGGFDALYNAENGNADDMFNVGRCFFWADEISDGYCLPWDRDRAMEYLTAAVSAGSQEAAVFLSEVYFGWQDDSVKDIAKAEEMAEVLAGMGSYDALLEFGYRYHDGYEVEQNDEKAFELVMRAAEGGNIEAMKALSWFYWDSIGCEKDPEQAIFWDDSYSRAKLAAEGREPAIFLDENNFFHVDTSLLNISLEEFTEAVGIELEDPQPFEWWGDRLSVVYFRYPGVDVELYLRDGKTSIIGCTLEAENGWDDGVYQQLCAEQEEIPVFIYSDGGAFFTFDDIAYIDMHAEPSDDTLVFTQKYVSWEYNGGDLYAAAGDSLYRPEDSSAPDYAAAAEWYLKAAELGVPSSMFNLGYMNYCGFITGEPDLEAAFDWFMKSAEAGDPSAMYNVGVMYDHGEGVGQDTGAAQEWYAKAAENGFAA